MVYLDSSAIVKLLVSERDAAALRRYLDTRHYRVSSTLARVEVLRTLVRLDADAETLARADEILARIALIPMDASVLSAAGRMEPPWMRTRDAVHLATALSLSAVKVVVTYDHRLQEAAVAAGLQVSAPSDSGD